MYYRKTIDSQWMERFNSFLELYKVYNGRIPSRLNGKAVSEYGWFNQQKVAFKQTF